RRPHEPSFFWSIQLSVRYDPTADCPAWDQFLADVLPPDVYASGLIWQLLAQLMVPTTDAHQSVLLVGPGGDGKSAFLSAVRAFLGERNISNLNLDQLTGERFAAEQLY